MIGLTRVKSPASITQLVAVLGGDEPTPIRCMAAQALLHQRDRRSEDVLRAVLADQASPPELLESAIRALAAIAPEGARIPISQLGLHDDWRVRWAASEALHDLNAPLATPLMEALAVLGDVPAASRARARNLLLRWAVDAKDKVAS